MSEHSLPQNEEIWKDIPDYEELYQASNLGNIRRKIKMSISNKYPAWGLLGQRTDSNGYNYITLTSNGVQSAYRVHRLIMFAFYGADSNKGVVNHINGIRNDNRLENLEWTTQSDNIKKAYENRTKRTQFHNSKFTESDIRTIKRHILDGKSNRELADKYGVGLFVISSIRNGKTWTNVEPYVEIQEDMIDPYPEITHEMIDNLLERDEICLIKAYTIEGFSNKSIADAYKIDEAIVEKIRNTKYYMQ